jgi:hypothetical protein
MSSPDPTDTHFDVAVIGAGSALETLVSTLGTSMRVVVFEPGRFGGECPFVACIPSKAILNVASTSGSWADGERFRPMNAAGKPVRRLPSGTAKNTKAVPGAEDNYPETYSYDPATKTVTVGGGKFGPVEPEVWGFEVSGLKVVQSWLAYRMKKRAGRKSSDLEVFDRRRGPSRSSSSSCSLSLNNFVTAAETTTKTSR